MGHGSEQLVQHTLHFKELGRVGYVGKQFEFLRIYSIIIDYSSQKIIQIFFIQIAFSKETGHSNFLGELDPLSLPEKNLKTCSYVSATKY